MKKLKHGFTLAEVLTTLAIIGVVAALTLPGLMASSNERAAITGVKKVANTLTEAASLNAAVDGYDYDNIDGFGDNLDDGQTIVHILGAHENVADINGGVIRFADGTTVSDGGACQSDARRGASQTTAITVDTNGDKAPNAAFDCTNDDCTQRSNRTPGDQFTLCVGGSQVWGDNAIAEWALMSN